MRRAIVAVCAAWLAWASVAAASSLRGGLERAAPIVGEGTQAPATTAPRLVSVMSGTSGETREGRFFITAPRTRFRVPDDTKVVVAFEWIGAPGPHRFTGTWRGPRGTSSTTEFEYTARERRFSAYWELPLSGSVPLGDWTLEARVDGEPAGTHEFQILGNDAEPAPAAPARRLPLDRRDAFARVLAMTARLEIVGPDGSVLRTAPATIVAPEWLVTSFSLLNNAARVRARTGPDRPPTELQEVVAYNRRQDWALFRAPGLGASAPAGTPEVPTHAGDACFSVAASSELALSVTPGEVVGATDHPVAGHRLLVSLSTAATPGAPVINEYGDVIGLVAAGMLPGGTDVHVPRFRDLAAINTPVIPVAVVPVSRAASPPIPLTELAARGEYVPEVTLDRQVLSGGFATGLLKDGPRTRPTDQRTEFSTADASVTIFVNWQAVEAFKGVASMHVFDIDNRQVAEATPSKITLRKGDVTITTWVLPRPAAGVYRVDVLLAREIAWRGYFRVSE